MSELNQDLRKGRISATQASKILCPGRFGGLYTAWCDSMGLLPEQPMSQAAANGLELESAVVRCFLREHPQFCALNCGTQVRGWRCATPDRVLFRSNPLAPVGPLEVKCRSYIRDWGNDPISSFSIPVEVRVQGWWQAHTLELPFVHFVVCQGSLVRSYEVRMSYVRSLMVDIDLWLHNIWEDYFETGTQPPAVCMYDYDLLARLTGSVRRVRPATGLEKELAAKHVRLSNEARELREEAAKIKCDLIQMADGHNLTRILRHAADSKEGANNWHIYGAEDDGYRHLQL